MRSECDDQTALPFASFTTLDPRAVAKLDVLEEIEKERESLQDRW